MPTPAERTARIIETLRSLQLGIHLGLGYHVDVSEAVFDAERLLEVIGLYETYHEAIANVDIPEPEPVPDSPRWRKAC